MKLTDEQEAILSGALRTSTNAITRLRSHILLLVSQGFSAARIQHLASVEPGQIADAVEKFHEGGIRAIVPRPQD